MNEQLDKVKAQLQEELKNVSSLQAKVSEVEVCVCVCVFEASNISLLHNKQIHGGDRLCSVISGDYLPLQRNTGT